MLSNKKKLVMKNSVHNTFCFYRFLFLITLMVGSLNGNAQIVYTDINPNIFDYTYPVDMNNDATLEFTITF